MARQYPGSRHGTLVRRQPPAVALGAVPATAGEDCSVAAGFAASPVAPFSAVGSAMNERVQRLSALATAGTLAAMPAADSAPGSALAARPRSPRPADAGRAR